MSLWSCINSKKRMAREYIYFIFVVSSPSTEFLDLLLNNLDIEIFCTRVDISRVCAQEEFPEITHGLQEEKPFCFVTFKQDAVKITHVFFPDLCI